MGPNEFGTSFSYGSALDPSTWGSGGQGNGGRGAGFLSFRIANKLRIEGVVAVDGEAKDSGGAGGSILMKVFHIDGDGSIQANGGAGSLGGGGSGGRIAVYFSNQSTYIGSIQAFGGAGSSDLGAAGTIYIHDLSLPSQPHRVLKVVNRNPQRILRPQVARVLQMPVTGSSACSATSVTYSNDVRVSTTATPYCTRSYSYPLQNIFTKGPYYLTLSSAADITLLFPFPLFVHRVIFYPALNWQYETLFKLSAFLATSQVTTSHDWIATFGAQSNQGETVAVGKIIDKVWA